MGFKVWDSKPARGHCTLLPPKDVEAASSLKKGRPVSHVWPDDVAFRMDPGFPRDTIVGDQVIASGNILVVCPAIARRTRELVTRDLEVLPVKILDHRGRLASAEHVVLNTTSVFDCVDTEASDIVWNDLDPTMFASAFDLVLEADAVPEDALMFRAKGMEHVVIVRDVLAEALAADGWTGIDFIPIDEFEV